MDSKFLKKINTYDKILIQSDEDSQKIYSFYAREGKSNHFPFQTGNIDIKFGGTGILFEQVGDLLYNLDFYCHDESGKVPIRLFSLLYNIQTDSIDSVDVSSTLDAGFVHQLGGLSRDSEQIRYILHYFLAVQTYAANYTEIVNRVARTEAIKGTPQKKQKKKKNAAAYRPLSRRVIVVSDVYNAALTTPKPDTKRSYSECSVKGHYRHYKSGKVVWIKPHKRNEGKDNSKQKIYMV